MSHEVFVAIGSNDQAEKNIHFALNQLRQHFGAIRCSTFYETTAVGFAGENFQNGVCSFKTTLTIEELSATLKQIEIDSGCPTHRPRFKTRPLDLDLLLYDDVIRFDQHISLPSPDILQYPFVLKPLTELAPNKKHPILNQDYKELWQHFNKTWLPLCANSAVW